MLPIASFAVVPADVAAATYPAPAPRFDVAWAAPYGLAYVAGDGAGDRLSEIASGVVDLRLELLVRLGRHIAIGPWASYGFVRPSAGCGSRLDIATDVDCGAHGSLQRAGFALELRARPDGGPWLSMGAGFEQLALAGVAHASVHTGSGDVTSDLPVDLRATGIEIGRFAGGFSFMVPGGFHLGPSASVSFGRYFAMTDQNLPLMIEQRTHGWISIGLRAGWDR